MLKLKLFSVKDLATDTFLQPQAYSHQMHALRDWEGMCNNSETNFYKFAADYALFEVGEFDLSTGTVSSLDAPHMLARATDLKKSVSNVSQL